MLGVLGLRSRGTQDVRARGVVTRRLPQGASRGGGIPMGKGARRGMAGAGGAAGRGSAGRSTTGARPGVRDLDVLAGGRPGVQTSSTPASAARCTASRQQAPERSASAPRQSGTQDTGNKAQGSQPSSRPGATPGGPGGRPSGSTFSRTPRALGPAPSCRAPGGRPCVGPSTRVAGAAAGHPTGSSTLRALGFRAADASAVAAASEARHPRCRGSGPRIGESA